MSHPSTTTDTSTHRSVFMSRVDKHVFAPRSYYIIGLSATSCSPGLVVIGSFSVPPLLHAVFHMFHLPEPTRPRGSVSLHQRQPVLRTRQTHSTHQRPFEFTADEPATARSEGKTPTLSSLGTGETWRGLSDGGERSVVLCGLISEYLEGQKTDNFKAKYKSLKGSSSVSWSH